MDLAERLQTQKAMEQSAIMGDGPEAVQAQHAEGKLTARERIAALLDEGSFIELDAFYQGGMEEQPPGGGVVTGYGTLGGRPVHLFAQDYTVMRGSVGMVHAQKIVQLVERALRLGTPLVGMFDSAGVRLREGLHGMEAYGRITAALSRASGVIPQIALVLGPCIGAASVAASSMDFVIAGGRGRMLMSGPQVLDAPDSLLASDAGVHLFAQTDEEALALAQKLVAFLPDNNLEGVPLASGYDDMNRLVSGIVQGDDAIYDAFSLMEEVSDAGSFMPLQEGHAPEMLTGFSRLGGRSVGILANQKGDDEDRLTLAGMKKAARMVRYCDAFGLPVITFVNTAGFVVGKDVEHQGISQAACTLAAAYAQATVPLVTVVTEKAIGSAAMVMGSRSLGVDQVFAWKGSRIQVLDADAASAVMFADRVEAADDPIAERKAIADEYAETLMSPMHAAMCGFTDRAIDPETTRQHVIAALEMSQSKREVRPTKKLAITPLV